MLEKVINAISLSIFLLLFFHFSTFAAIVFQFCWFSACLVSYLLFISWPNLSLMFLIRVFLIKKCVNQMRVQPCLYGTKLSQIEIPIRDRTRCLKSLFFNFLIPNRNES